MKTMKFKRIFAFVLVLALITATLPLNAFAASGYWTDYAASSFESGDGSKENPYEIATAAQLAYMANRCNEYSLCYPNYHCKLTSDLNMSGHYWKPIRPFSGVLDGQGHVITGIDMSDLSTDMYIGFIGETYSEAVVANLGVNVEIHAGNAPDNDLAFVGGLVGDNCGTIINCFSSGIVNANLSYCTDTGGLAGASCNMGSVIINSYSTADVVGGGGYCDTGGLVGNGGYTINCYAAGNVTQHNGVQNRLGGLLGSSSFDFPIANCHWNDAIASGFVEEGNPTITCSSALSPSVMKGGAASIEYVNGAGEIVTAENFVDALNRGAERTSAKVPSGLALKYWMENSNGGYPVISYDQMQLTRPTGLSCAGSGTVVSWNSVPKASGYKVQLITNYGPIIAEFTTTSSSYDFFETIKAKGTATYTFVITALGDGMIYLNSEMAYDDMDYIFPVLSKVTSEIFVGNDSISTTMNKEGTLYLVPTGSYADKAALDAISSKVTAPCTAGVAQTLSVAGLSAGAYQVYGVDTIGMLTVPSSLTINYIFPVLSNVTSLISVGNNSISATMSKEGTLYIVPTGSYANKAALDAISSKVTASCTANVAQTLSVAGLSAGAYQVYGVDTGGVLATPSPLTLTKGYGTQSEPFVINTPQELKAIENKPSAYYELGNDIDISDYGRWAPIKYFNGGLNGNGYKITGLSVGTNDLPHPGTSAGLFVSINAGGVVENLGVDITIFSSLSSIAFVYVGGLAGTNNGTIINCYSTGEINVNARSSCVGGLVGLNNNKILNSYATNNIAVSINISDPYINYVGGLVGQCDSGSLINCYATGNVSSEDSHSRVGGLVGETSSATCVNCYWNSSSLIKKNNTEVKLGIGSNMTSQSFPTLTSLSSSVMKGEAASILYYDGISNKNATKFISALNGGRSAISDIPSGVTLKYWEADSNTAPQNFNFPVLTTITPTNNAPSAKNPVPTQNISAGSNASFTAADIAEDTDGDALTVTGIVTEPDSTYATASLNSGAVTITGVSAGSTSVTVTVSDGNGGTVDVTVPIEVTAAVPSNHAPTAKTPVPTLSVIVGSDIIFNASDIAEDTDGDALEITSFVTSPSAIVTASITSGEVTITGEAAGSTSVTVTVSDGNGGTVDVTVPIEVTAATPSNHAPTAKSPVPTQSMTVGSNVSFNASDIAEDTDGDALEITSFVTSPSAIVTASLNSGEVTITGVAAGSTFVTVTVSDGKGETVDVTVPIDVTAATPSNHAPTAKSTVPTQSMTVGSNASFTAADIAEDTDGDALEITSFVTSPSAIVTASITSGEVTITGEAAGSTSVTVTVSDGKGGTVDVTVPIEVTAVAPSNHAPTAKFTVPIQSMTVSSNVSFTATYIAEDEDSDALTITGIVTVPDSTYATASLNSGEVTITGVAAGSTFVTVTVSDGKGETVDVTVPIDVIAATPSNHAPTAKSTVPTQSMTVGSNASFIAADIAEDTDGDALEITSFVTSPSAIVTASLNSGEVTITGVAAGSTSVTVTVSDGKGETVDVTVPIEVTAATPSNHAPTAKFTVPTQSMTVSSNVSFTATYIAEDEDGDALTITGIVIEPDSTYATASMTSGTVTITGVATGSTSIVVTVSDGNGGTVNVTVPIEVTVAADVEISIIQRPFKTILNAITFGLFFDDTVDVSISCTDIVDHYEYQTVADGDTFDENGIWTEEDSFSIVPDFKGRVYARSVYGNGTTSAYTVRALVVDKTKPTISASYDVSSGSIEVSVIDSGAGIEKITYQVGTDVEQTINLEPSETLGITTQHSFTINSLPDGKYDVVINASDNSGNAAATKTVPVDRGGTAPTINTNSLDDGVVGTSYRETLTATSDTPITWSIDSGDLPDGLTLDLDTGEISGTPTEEGSFSFTAKAENSDGNDTKTLSIEIDLATPIGAAPTINTNSLNDGVVGTSYSQMLVATGASITWSVYSGDLPKGLTLNGSTISGTPTTRGTFSFTVKAENSEGDDTKTLSIYISPASSDNDGGNNGGGSSGGGSSITPTIAPDKKPDQPVIAASPLIHTVDANGKTTITVPQQTVVDTINKAVSEATKQGRLANGIGVSLETQNSIGTKVLGIVLTQPTLKLLTDSKVRHFEVDDDGFLTINFDLEALKEIQKQSTGDVSITLVPATGLSEEAKTLMGIRTVYNITLSYVKDGKTANITSLNKGSVTLSIPYTPGKNEAVGYLFGVYVDGNGKATRIDGSTYDANSKSVIFDSNHFSVYGVGYMAPSAKITDISTHWAKESIDYVVGRGLLGGTANTTFIPDTAMSRGMLVTALGRLASANVSDYKTSSFTDVKADSSFLPYIEWAYKKGMVSGIENSQFAPDRAATREEIAVILQNYAKATGYTLPITREVVTFADSSNISVSFKDSVKAMQQAGIMSGKDNGYFDPKGTATRAEAATMLHRYIKLTMDPDTAQGWVQNDAGQYLYYKDGKALTGTQTIDGVKYVFNSNSVLQTKWVKDGDHWRFYSGKTMLVGWWDLGANGNKKTYYFTKEGLMVSGKWLEIGDKWYYFNTDGSLARSTKIDSDEVDENGVRKTK